MEYKIVRKLSKKQIIELLELYKNEWWTKTRELQDIETMLNNSPIIIGVEDSNGKLVGFARVLTDFVYKAFIFDVIIDRKHRGKGLGSSIMNTIVNHNDLKNIKHFELYCLEEMKPFYQKWGFRDESSSLVFLRRSDC